jgi:TonB-linked SusC/RagA family outer membrane protein
MHCISVSVRAVVLALAVSPVGSAGAQSLGTIRGTVTERGSGSPLGRVEVVLDGSARGAVTGANGSYVLSAVPAGTHTLRARLIGFAPGVQTVTVQAGGAATASFALAQSAVSLDKIVVTGVPMATSARTLGNAVTTVNAAEVSRQTATVNVSELLQARAPGVSVMQSSGTAGTAGTIRIRGIGSLVSSTNPVVYVDGVRIASGAAGNFRNSYESPAQATSAFQTGGGQDAGLLGNVSAEEIESIEVIKGPAAATLYGADAANGVIQIITKHGRAGEQLAQWRMRAQGGLNDWSLSKRTNLTTCTAERIGQQLANGGGPAYPGCQSLSPGTVVSSSGLSSPGVLRNGAVGNFALSLTGGGQGYSYFTEVGRTQDQGVIRNNDYDMSSGRANFSFIPQERLSYSVNLGYSRSHTRFPMGDNGANLLESAWTAQPGTPTPAGQMPGFAFGTPVNFDIYDNRLVTDRVTAGTTLSYAPAAWFHNQVVLGADLTSGLANRYIAPGSLWSPNEGQMTQGSPRSTVYTANYAGTVTTPLPRFASLSSALSFGAQFLNQQTQNTISQGNGFLSASVKDIRLATVTTGWDEYSDIKSLGLFVQEQVGWADRLFVTGAVRMDNSSVFGSNINKLYYPKLSVSYVASDQPFFRSIPGLGSLKLRAAWGAAGIAPDPFAAVRSYTSVPTVNAAGQLVPSLVLATSGNPDVKPERGQEIEAGFDASFFHDRMGVELTYYDKITKDALMLVPNPPSQGFPGSTYRNLGEISNRGVELGLTASPIQAADLAWDMRLSMFANRNRLVKFGYDRGPLIFGLTAQNQRDVPGYPIGGFWVHDAPVLDPATDTYSANPSVHFLGSADPVRELAFGNTFTVLRNFRLYGLIDYKGGFYVTNQTDQRRCAAGVCAQLNDPATTPEQRRLLLLDIATNDAPWTQPGDFVKLRDLSLGYQLPAAVTSRLRTDRASLTLAAHNVAILWTKGYSGLDPEVNFAGSNGPTGEFGLARVDYWTMPQTRRIALSLDLTF